MEAREAASAITRWFAQNGRLLPWRTTHEPYHVLVSEFILQQTRMEVGVPRFESFVSRFPTIRHLARARESSVLAEWSGLGYYARARNLHKAAKRIVEDFDGRVPEDPSVLRDLPGIGPYTAGAIASIAYDRPEPSLDGNQFRVLGRFLGQPVAPKFGRQTIEAWARLLLREGSPRVLNQAIMDLGGSVCLPEKPRCEACPLVAGCATRGPGPDRQAAKRPVPVQGWKAPRYVRNGRVWLAAPHNDGLLGTHWLPPLSEGRLRRAPDLEHTFSHRRWNVWFVDAQGEPKGNGKWVALADLRRLPHGPLTRRFVEAALTTSVDARRVRRPRARAEARAAP